MSLCPERVSNPRPFRCKRNDLPLIYRNRLWVVLSRYSVIYLKWHIKPYTTHIQSKRELSWEVEREMRGMSMVDLRAPAKGQGGRYIASVQWFLMSTAMDWAAMDWTLKALMLEMEKEGLWLWRNHKQGIQLNFSGSGSDSLDYVAAMLIVAWINISLGIRFFLINKVRGSEWMSES